MNEYTWDLQNYHYFNAFAFIHNTYDQFFIPSGINSFFNPLLDIPLYFYIEYLNNYPFLIYGLQGINTGILLCAAYKITLLLFDKPTYKAMLYGILTIIIILLGEYVFTQMGSSSNETISSLVISFLYLCQNILENSGNK